MRKAFWQRPIIKIKGHQIIKGQNMPIIKIWCQMKEYRELHCIGTAHIVAAYKKQFSIWWSKFLLHLDCEYLTSAVTIPHWGILAHYKHMSEFERGRSIGLKKAGWTNRIITRYLGRSDAKIRRCLQSGSKTIDISVKTVAVDPGPQQNAKTEWLSEQLSQHQFHRYQISTL